VIRPGPGPGRPPVGDRVVVRLPDELLADIDRRAAALGRSRASVIRSLLDEVLGRSTAPDDGVDRTQLHRVLAMTPGQRMHHALDLAGQQRRLRGSARRRR
jgi:Arc/MetJ-type ribon-helix-helix transcriptional regulator